MTPQAVYFAFTGTKVHPAAANPAVAFSDMVPVWMRNLGVSPRSPRLAKPATPSVQVT